MKDVNSVALVGRLTRDAELKYTQSGTALINLGIANNYSVKKGETWEDEVSFFDGTLWGKLAESLAQYLLKGKQIAITGEIRQQRWEKDGQNRSKVVININTIQLLGGKSEGSESSAPTNPTAPTAQEPPKPQGNPWDDI